MSGHSQNKSHSFHSGEARYYLQQYLMTREHTNPTYDYTAEPRCPSRHHGSAATTDQEEARAGAWI